MATNVATKTKEPDQIALFRRDLYAMRDQFAAVMPEKLVERFMRTAMTAVQNNPTLVLDCEPRSVIGAIMLAAQDNLLPDKREGAIIPYGEEDDTGRKRKVAQWQPMVYGIRKRIRESGEIADLNVQVVQEGDSWDYQLGDDPYIHHKPAKRGGRNRPVIAAYSIATFKDGTISREVMNIDQIMAVAAKSRARKGPWHDATFFPEMCRKTVAKLHAKQLPMGSDIETIFRRGDEDYDFDRPSPQLQPPQRRAPPSTRVLLDKIGAGDDEPAPEREPPPPPQDERPKGKPATAPIKPDDSDAPAPRPAAGPPKNEAEYRAFAENIIADENDAEQLLAWWDSAVQRKLRNSAGVTKETFDALAARVNARCEALAA